jgi:DNA invertase Pin-like site-specific DNA recombinase
MESIAIEPELNRLMAMRGSDDSMRCSAGNLTDGAGAVADSIKSIQELVSLGARFVAVKQNIDTDESNPMARFLLHIMAAFAEPERALIRERVVAGVKAAKANGKRLGRPKRLERPSVSL